MKSVDMGKKKPANDMKRLGLGVALAAAMLGTVLLSSASARCHCGKRWPHLLCREHGMGHATGPGDVSNRDGSGEWYWVRSPEQERRVALNLFNRYCIRCHGVDGRGVWDIPDVPDFTNHVWQSTRPDDYRSRVILEGRGAVMPSFRGAITLEESWALARFLHSLEPGQEVSRPGLGPAAPATPTHAAAPASTPAPAANPPASPPHPAAATQPTQGLSAPPTTRTPPPAQAQPVPPATRSAPVQSQPTSPPARLAPSPFSP